VQKVCSKIESCPIVYIPQIRVESTDMLYDEYKRVLLKKGEGVVLKRADSLYTTDRSWNRVKYKGREDIEGIIKSYNLNG
jgi:ATP-dependent DNA ligase